MKSVISQICPYPGPRSFNENESILFKGRDQYLEHISKKLAEHHFILITGASGDGKSSLIFAGLIPYAKAGFLKSKYHSWSLADFRPKRNPLGNLATSLAYTLGYNDIERVENKLQLGYSALIDLYKNSPLFEGSKSESSNLIILADQFEEFFTNENNYNQDSGTAKPEAQMVVQILLETISIAQRENLPVYVICTMRSDYFGHCTAFSGFPKLIVKSQFYLERLNKLEILQAIREPAILCGYKVSERLLQVLMNEITEDIGVDMLPILQHCLYQIWKCADDGKNEMDLLHYAMVGGYPKEQLVKEDQSKFEKWFNQLPENLKSSYKKPSLRNVLDIHANRLYDTAHNYFNENNTDKKTITKEEAQRIIEIAFKCLTKIDDRRAVRNLMSLEEITEMIGDKNMDTVRVGKVLDYFRIDGNSFIRPFFTKDPVTQKLKPKTVLDISHEALMRNWNKLEEWALKENEDAISYRELVAQLNKWLTNNKAQSNLLSAGNLIYFERWYKNQNTNPIAWLKRYMDYEDNTISENKKDERSNQHLDEIKEYLGQSRKKINRLRKMTVAGFAVVTSLLIFSLFALYSNKKLQEDIKRTAKANEIATQAFLTLEKDPTLAFRIAEQAYLIEPTPLTKQVIMAAYGEAPFYKKLEEHNAAVNKAAYSPDGKYFVTGDGNGVVILWDANGNMIHKMKEHKQHINYQYPEAISFSPDSRFFLTASFDSTARLWNLKGECLAVLKHDNVVSTAVFSPIAINELSVEVQHALFNEAKVPKDSSWFLLTASYDKTARIWAMKGNLIKELKGHGGRVMNANFSPDCRYILTSSADQTVRIWDIVTGRYVVLKGHTDEVFYSFFSCSGKYVVTCSWDKTAQIWNNTGKFLSTLKGHAHIVSFGFFIDNDKSVVTSSDDGTARIWDVSALLNTGLEGNETIVYRGHEPNGIWMINISRDEQNFITASDDGTARIWNRQGRELMALNGHTDQVLSSIFSPKEDKAVTTSFDRTVLLWNIKMQETPILKGHSNYVNDAEFSLDGKHIATAGSDYTARLWTGKGNYITTFKGHKYYAVESIAFSPDGQRIVTTSKYTDAGGRVWDLEGNNLLYLKGHKGIVGDAFYTHNGQYIITYGDDKTARLYDTSGVQRQIFQSVSKAEITKDDQFIITPFLKDTTILVWEQVAAKGAMVIKEKDDTALYLPLLKIGDNHAGIIDVTVSSNQQWIAVAYQDSILHFYDFTASLEKARTEHRRSVNVKSVDLPVRQKEVKYSLQLPAGISLLRYSLNSRHLLAVLDNNTVAVFSLESFEESRNSLLPVYLIGHTNIIKDANFSPDSKHIVTASNDFTYRVWNLKGEQLQLLTGHKAAVEKAKFSPDGNYILTASLDHTARLIPWRVEDVLHKINIEKVRGDVWKMSEKDKEVYGIK